ncbi:Hypothetical predicted protein [Olea europaea subsp. europaea]|uniref:Uncharacterized protein n=1 Tax=Olea europaea subsp. europaea TaxID=158383 RepID=A0A8S0RZD7_OLEEU|nr:Hypothetical predicted protein [Olea europaea subsp. europaea]
MQFVGMVCRPYPGRVLVAAVSGTWCARQVQDAAGTHPDFEAISGTRCVGHVHDTAGTHPDFHVFLGNFLDTVSRQFSGRVGAAAGMQSNFQDVAGTHLEFQVFLGSFWNMVCMQCLGCIWAVAVSRTWCTGHDGDASGPRQGRSLIFRLFWEVFGHGLQATSGILRGQAPLGHGVQAMSRTRPRYGHVQDASWSWQGYNLIFRPCPGCVLIAVGTQPDFQALLGSFWGTVYGHVRDAS